MQKIFLQTEILKISETLLIAGNINQIYYIYQKFGVYIYSVICWIANNPISIISIWKGYLDTVFIIIIVIYYTYKYRIFKLSMVSNILQNSSAGFSKNETNSILIKQSTKLTNKIRQIKCIYVTTHLPLTDRIFYRVLAQLYIHIFIYMYIFLNLHIKKKNIN